MIEKYTNKKTRAVIVIFIIAIMFVILSSIQPTKAFEKKKAPSLSELNSSISKAQVYYEGLYRPMGNKGAVVAEYYSGNKSIYTVRHGVIGGIFYYTYTKNISRASELKKFAKSYGFNPYYDDHSFIWTNKNNAPEGIVYSLKEYRDCTTSLPTVGNVSAYHSKVCKAGVIGENMYLLLSQFDPLLPIEDSLQQVESGKKVSTVSFEKLYNALGFGIPICTPLGCSLNASTIRTAQFGELELKTKHTQYADAVASDLIHSENKDGAIYISYDKKGKLDSSRSFIYTLLDKFLNDKPIFKGVIPTNAESMNDALAFLMQYRCDRYGVCN
ncbi:MAG TPA: hypothetical protein VF941_11895 [Clostridia bacterium]